MNDKLIAAARRVVDTAYQPVRELNRHGAKTDYIVAAHVINDLGALLKPQRIQLRRKKGFNLQRVSRELNWLPAVNCARPGRWGNPYKVGIGPGLMETNADAKAAFLNYTWRTPEGIQLSKEAKKELRGKNLACWCKLDQPCHCDVLLDLANHT